MPNVSSPAITNVTESIDSNIGGFRTESMVPGVEGFLENLPKVATALEEAIVKLAAYLEDERPVHPDVTEALRELRVPLGAMRERADEAYTTFKKRHEQELDQHYNPRAGENAWNTGH